MVVTMGVLTKPEYFNGKKSKWLFDKIEFMRFFHQIVDMQTFPNLGIELLVFFIWDRTYGI